MAIVLAWSSVRHLSDGDAQPFVHDPRMLVLQFLSSDECLQADCRAYEWSEDTCRHVAIHLGRALRGAEQSMVRASTMQARDGRYVKYAAGVFTARPRRQVASGECQIFAFPTADDLKAFCLLSGALPARFVRALSIEKPS